MIPPIKPAFTSFAKYAPIIPGANPGLSAILNAIYPPNIGMNKAKPAAPIWFSLANQPVSGTAACPLKVTDKANNIPPATTNGII